MVRCPATRAGLSEKYSVCWPTLTSRKVLPSAFRSSAVCTNINWILLSSVFFFSSALPIGRAEIMSAPVSAMSWLNLRYVFMVSYFGFGCCLAWLWFEIAGADGSKLRFPVTVLLVTLREESVVGAFHIVLDDLREAAVGNDNREVPIQHLDAILPARRELESIVECLEVRQT